MGSRNYVGRTLLLLALALAVGIAVALMSGEERARTVEGRHSLVIEHQTAQRRAQPPFRIDPAPSCTVHEGCARL
ncbi:MAG: hypothetical protein ACREX3_09115 [Gammaproteobacteria bacterium]